jgi:rhodanese-related sulfurtransferase
MQTITAEELKQRLDAGETVQILDVREPHEREEFNIGGHFIPLGDLRSMQTDAIDDLKEQELIVYCRSGNRSGQACLLLESMGFTNVKNLEGGMLQWTSKFA